MRLSTYLGLLLMVLLGVQEASALDIGGTVKAENAYGYQQHQWQKQVLEVDLEVSGQLPKGNFTGIAKGFLDQQTVLNPASTPSTYASGRALRYDAPHGGLELRELYWEFETDLAYWRLGKQQVVWGEADGLKLLDVVNPQSYREFMLDDFDESRIPLWMFNGEFSLPNDSILQLLWIVDGTTHELAPSGSPYEFTSPLLVPQKGNSKDVRIEDPKAPSHWIRDSDFGVRLAHFWNGWDITLNYLYHYIDEPVLRTSVEGMSPVVSSDYERSQLFGGSASTALGDWILRAELAYETDRYQRSVVALPGVVKTDQWGSVVGLDYQGWTDQLLSIQWFQSRVFGQESLTVKEKRENVMSLIWEHRFLNDTLTLRASNLHSLNRHDGLVRVKVSYNMVSNLDVYLGGDRFYGDNKGLFGQFDQADRVVVGVELGF